MVIKVADKVADMVADLAADIVTNLGTPNLVRELVTGVNQLGTNFFDPKLTQLACLLSFASLLLM